MPNTIKEKIYIVLKNLGGIATHKELVTAYIKAYPDYAINYTKTSTTSEQKISGTIDSVINRGSGHDKIIRNATYMPHLYSIKLQENSNLTNETILTKKYNTKDNLPFIEDFAKFFAEFLDNKQLSSSYVEKKTKKEYKFITLADALAQYRWGNHSFDETEKLLSKYSNELKNAILKKDLQKVHSTCIKILEWGKVTNGNIQTLEDFIANESIWKLFNFIEKAHIVFNGTYTFPKDFKSNSGFTKIYALAVDDFIIYDSRVAASLCVFIREYCNVSNTRQLPIDLSLTWTSGKETLQNKNIRNRRNPSNEKIRFEQSSGGAKHFISNLKANKIIALAIEKAKTKWTPREVEAALFMLGYDITNFKV